ncbi:MAG: prepilin-type N-terminal cleavage/methylation domain-containing protein [Planctomycetota bacterium]|nr:MAG: prepilin-type N-terminal cleavage/methylation domain-containing protein [Planctomycetota bacterium]
MTRRGFSLLEVMLAIGIVLVLSGVIYAFLFDLMDARERIVRYSDRSRVGIGMMETIERDLMTTLAGSSRFGAGIKGGSTWLTLLSRSVTLPIETDSQTVLGDLQGVKFEWQPGRGELRASRWDVLSGETALSEVISEEIEHLQIRYYDGRAWRGTFDSSTTGRLPVALEVAVWFGTPRRPAPSAGSFESVGFRDEPGFNEAFDPGSWERETTDVQLPTREPDRVRVMVIPDGPEVGMEASP